MKDGMNVEEIAISNLDKIPEGLTIMETDMQEDQKNLEVSSPAIIRLREKDMEDREVIILLLVFKTNQLIPEKKVVKLILINKAHTDLPMDILLLIKKDIKDKIPERENVVNNLDLQSILNEKIFQVDYQVRMLTEDPHILHQGNLQLVGTIIHIDPTILLMEV